MALLVVASTDLILRPSFFSVGPKASPTDVAGPGSWFDLFATLCVCVVVIWPHAAQSAIGRGSVFSWRASGLFTAPRGAQTAYQPALLVFAAITGLYAAMALFSLPLVAMAAFMGHLTLRGVACVVLRPLVAWTLLAVVARSFTGLPKADPGG